MKLSCLFHRWSAGRNSDSGVGSVPASLSRHAESCARCAAYTQRMRALDSRFRSVRGTGEGAFPEGLHAKIIDTVREVRLEPAHAAAAASAASIDSDSGNQRGLYLFLGGAAAVALWALFAFANPGIDDTANHQPGEIAAVTPPVDPIAGSPESPLSNPEIKNEPRPTATRRVAEFTGELPSYLVSKVSKPYESEMEFLADDLNAATDFLSACIFVSDLRQPSTDL